MRQTDVIVIGGGQAGLAMSHHLSAGGIDHAVLERARVGERWRSAWDSLRLLTPTRLNALPGAPDPGSDPDGFVTTAELIGHLEAYARAIGAPVETGIEVRRVERIGGRFRITTDSGAWSARAVVVATGHCDQPFVPPVAARLAPAIRQITPRDYRNPAELPEGGVLVVGASASGAQLAEEIHRSGRPVTLAVGRHSRLPRRYRGADVLVWMDRAGMLTELAIASPSLARARTQPSLQLIGSPEHRTLDLGVLRDMGVRLVGRLLDIDGTALSFSDDLARTTAGAQATLERLLARIDPVADAHGAPAEPRPAPLAPFARSPEALDLASDGIRTVLWATGYRRSYPWLRVPVLDDAGEIVHAGGVTPAPGLFVLGLRFLRRRNSNFLGGVGADADALAAEIRTHLAMSDRIAA
ncbi:flavin-containing monooxygenase [Elioraea sp.]|uniref:flavin-containing monooxygenase n=1 Tax=Elioraea sp. TaxID=2185103 RepID=UPI003F6F2C50